MAVALLSLSFSQDRQTLIRKDGTMGKQKRNKSPAYSDRVIVENCINAYIDGGNNIQAMWDYLRLLIGRGDITEPYAKVKAKESLDCIKSTERLTRNWK